MTDQLQDVVSLTTRVLGRDVVGAYLHGSAVLGGLRPASDLDIFAVTTRSASHQQRQELVDGLLDLSGSVNNARPVELVVAVQTEVRPWRYPPVADLLYGEWLRPQYQAGQLPSPTAMPDLAILCTMVLAGGRPLLGPPPAQVLDPVPERDLRRASLDALPGLLEDLAGDTRNVVLTLARIWVTLATGELRSKAEAADWVLPRLPAAARSPLAHAHMLYQQAKYSEESWSPELLEQVPGYVAAVLAEIDQLS